MPKTPNIPDAVIEKWQTIVDLISRLLNVPSAVVTRAEPPMIEAVRTNETPENPFRSGLKVEIAGHFCEEVIRRRGRLHVHDARSDPRWNDAPDLAHGIVSYLGYPLAWPSGAMFGTICVLDRKPLEIDPLREQLLQEFSGVIETHLELLERNETLARSLDEIRVLRGILPICAACKKVRNEAGYWEQVEAYITTHSEAMFSHGLCPDCLEQLYPQFNQADGRRAEA